MRYRVTVLHSDRLSHEIEASKYVGHPRKNCRSNLGFCLPRIRQSMAGEKKNHSDHVVIFPRSRGSSAFFCDRTGSCHHAINDMHRLVDDARGGMLLSVMIAFGDGELSCHEPRKRLERQASVARAQKTQKHAVIRENYDMALVFFSEPA